MSTIAISFKRRCSFEIFGFEGLQRRRRRWASTGPRKMCHFYTKHAFWGTDLIRDIRVSRCLKYFSSYFEAWVTFLGVTREMTWHATFSGRRSAPGQRRALSLAARWWGCGDADAQVIDPISRNMGEYSHYSMCHYDLGLLPLWNHWYLTGPSPSSCGLVRKRLSKAWTFND